LLTRVDELISPITGQWDEELVRDIFCEVDARQILQIPLRQGVDDFIAWHFDSKGNHSVKSAYKLHVELHKQEQNGAPGASSARGGNLDAVTDQSWSRIWKMPCPRKLQMFVWRMRHESLAVCANLMRRGLKLDQ